VQNVIKQKQSGLLAPRYENGHEQSLLISAYASHL